jgi:hypothetical protein
MTYLRSLLLVALCCLASFAQAQDGQKYSITRWHLEPDALPDFITEIAKFNAVYSKSVDFDWFFYAYDDNTVEVCVPIRDHADIDRMEAAFDFSRSMVPKEKMEAMYDPAKMKKIVTKVEDYMVESIPELSYVPVGEEGMEAEMKIYQLNRYRTSFGNDEKMRAHGKKLVDMMKKANSPLHMNMYAYETGDRQIFEVTLSGKDRADLDRRLKLHQERLSGPEIDAWTAVTEELFPRIHRTIATEIEELGHKKEPTTIRRFAVNRETIKPGKKTVYLAAAKQLNKDLRAAGADLYWGGNLSENNEAMFFARIHTMSDVDKVFEDLAKRRYQLSPVQLKKHDAAISGLISKQEVMVLEHHENLSYLQQERYSEPAYSHTKAVTYEYDPADRAKVMTFLKNTREQFKKAGGKCPYEVWTYSMGGPSNQVVIVDWGKDKASLDAAIANDLKLMDAEWVKEVTALFKEVETVYAQNRSELSYLPEE